MAEKMIAAVFLIAWPLALGYSLYRWLCRDISRAVSDAFRP